MRRVPTVITAKKTTQVEAMKVAASARRFFGLPCTLAPQKLGLAASTARSIACVISSTRLGSGPSGASISREDRSWFIDSSLFMRIQPFHHAPLRPERSGLSPPPTHNARSLSALAAAVYHPNE